jgi:hypothetical protein
MIVADLKNRVLLLSNARRRSEDNPSPNLFWPYSPHSCIEWSQITSRSGPEGRSYRPNSRVFRHRNSGYARLPPTPICYSDELYSWPLPAASRTIPESSCPQASFDHYGFPLRARVESALHSKLHGVSSRFQLSRGHRRIRVSVSSARAGKDSHCSNPFRPPQSRTAACGSRSSSARPGPRTLARRRIPPPCAILRRRIHPNLLHLLRDACP